MIIKNMTNLEVLILGETLAANLQTLKDLQGAKFNYCITRNIDRLNAEIKLITGTIEPSSDYKKYDESRVSLCEEFCKKDENGELMKIQIGPDQFEYDIDTESEGWINALEKLKTEYKETIEKRAKQLEDYNTFLQENSNVELYKISMDYIPEIITLEQMALIKDFIIEE